MINVKPSFILFLIISLFSGFIKEIILLLFCITIHELGHIIMILIFKHQIKSVEITGIGCFINVAQNNENVIKSLFIYSGGLIFNILSILIFNNNLIIQFSKLLIFINLIPINPLDGFQIINTFLNLFYENEFINDVLFYIGLLINTLLLIFSLIFKVYFLIILCFFLFIRLFKFRKTKKFNYLQNYFKLSF